ncbi:hypothetical protein FPZ12_007110 [Amycolatopsis acidicola]|uniref:SRPBCC family protein n=1 Tax=Amycolatopsis acidicola TaxID=2596893 RepID=A0A5N0VH73_9PSEU|nr:hypothetical protein [Amycolatopsis acidicola]KAA9165008.1 hypothetical protein FPZ12_007110 [Amycolatopsis acidicola]
MSTFRYTAPADLPADEAFAFISDAPNLLTLLPEADRAWITTDEANRRLHWGTESEGEDHGELRVRDRGPDMCEVEVSVASRRDGEQVRQELEEAVAALTHKASADADLSGST